MEKELIALLYKVQNIVILHPLQIQITRVF